VRGSDPDAALYWLARMLDGGCDPRYVRGACCAWPPRTSATPIRARWHGARCLGGLRAARQPGGRTGDRAGGGVLACAAKSNAVYVAFGAAMADAKRARHARGAAAPAQRADRADEGLGYGKGYRYAHDEPDGYAAGEKYFPDEMPPARYYEPPPRGLEIKIGEKLADLAVAPWRRGPQGPLLALQLPSPNADWISRGHARPEAAQADPEARCGANLAAAASSSTRALRSPEERRKALQVRAESCATSATRARRPSARPRRRGEDIAAAARGSRGRWAIG
jgi:hypothetical protein